MAMLQVHHQLLVDRHPTTVCLHFLTTPTAATAHLVHDLKLTLRRSGGSGLRNRSNSVSTASANLPGRETVRHVEDLERKRKKIFGEGFAVFPQIWSKEEIQAAAGEIVVGQQQQEFLELFITDSSDVLSRRYMMQEPGFCCTDASTSPEPWWHQSWQVEGLGFDDLHHFQVQPWIATLVLSISDGTGRKNCGGVAVFPRSHWIFRDWITASKFQTDPFPQPCDVPSAAPIELELGCGDMVLMHPWLAHTLAPNMSSSSAHLLFFHIAEPNSKHLTSRSSSYRIEHMWAGWHSSAEYLMEEPLNVEAEVNQLRTEEAKAQLGGWQDTIKDRTLGLWGLTPALISRVAPRDFLIWRLHSSTIQFMKDEEWSKALSLLQRLAGLRPTCYWTALQAGQCCMNSAPAGQLGGRAGRKCMLEDGERFLLRAIEVLNQCAGGPFLPVLRDIQEFPIPNDRLEARKARQSCVTPAWRVIAPGWPVAYAQLTKCLALMGRGRELEIPEVVKMMKRKCSLEQLCLRYPATAAALQSSWNTCEAALSSLSHKHTSTSGS